MCLLQHEREKHMIDWSVEYLGTVGRLVSDVSQNCIDTHTLIDVVLIDLYVCFSVEKTSRRTRGMEILML